MALTKTQRRQRIKNRIRKTISGTQSQPRLVVYRSNNEIYAQLINDINGVTIVAASSRDKELSSKKGTKTEVAALVGKLVGEVVGKCVGAPVKQGKKLIKVRDKTSKSDNASTVNTHGLVLVLVRQWVLEWVGQ